MPNRRIIYLAGFDITGVAGRAKATREKTNSLRRLLGNDNFELHFPYGRGGIIPYYIRRVTFDLQMRICARKWTSDCVVVMRQAYLPLTHTFLVRHQVPVVQEIHGVPGEETVLLTKNLFEKTIINLLTRIERRQLQRATGIIYNHPFLAYALSKIYGHPSIWCYNGANTQELLVKDRSLCRQRLGLDLSATYLLFLGEISPWHGVELLIDLFRQPAMQPFTLLLAGSINTAYGNRLRNLAAGLPNVAFADAAAPGAAVDFINAADICLLPVNTKLRASPGSPIKLYDYIACGRPVAAQANTPGYSDEVEQNGLGISVDFNNAVAASEALAGFVTTFNADHYQMHNRAIAEGALSWDARMTTWIEFLLKL